MKLVKKIIILLVLLFLLMVLYVETAHSQSDRKINRDSKESGLYVKVALRDSSDIYFERDISCELELVTHFVNNRHFIAHTSKFELDLDVKDRKVGEYNSWVVKDRFKENWYFITPFRVGGAGEGFGVIIQPITKTLQIRYDEPIITIANFNLCVK